MNPNHYNKKSKNIIHHSKHFFIPHAHNDYKPHIFREASVSIILATTLFLFSLSMASAYIIQATEIGKDIISKVLIDTTNKNRKDNSLPALYENKKLYLASSLKAKDMIENQYFAHQSPSGLKPWHFLNMAKYDYIYAGENLAINHTDNTQTEKAWMDSPLHRKNILDSNFKEIGISAYSGEYGGKQTIFVVQMFGAPAEEPTPAIIYTTTEPVSEPKKVTVKKEVMGLNPESKEIIIKENKQPTNISTDTSIDTKTNKIILTQTTPEIKINTNSNQKQNIQVLGEKETNYAKVYEKIIYSGSDYVQNMLQILLIVIFVAALLMVFIEIRKQHLLHIAYAVLLLIILITLMYLNKNYLELNLMFL